MKAQGYSAQEIAEQLSQNRFDVPTGELREPPPPIVSTEPYEDYFAKHNDVPEIELDLTDEDKKYLNIKWGRTYKPEEWV